MEDVIKLIDFLVDVLGGWPVDKKHHAFIAQDDDGELWAFSVKPNKNITRGVWEVPSGNGCYLGIYARIADDCSTSIVTREQYESALAASKKAEWDGVGLPPVGLAVEMQYAGGEWLAGILIAHGEEQIIFKYDGEREFSGHRNNYEFRPARSETDKNRDNAIEMMIDIFFNTPPADSPNEEDRLAMTQLYDAIAAGKIPHVHID